MDLKVTGAEDLARAAKALKAVGAGDLRKELLRGIRETGKPVIGKVRANALVTLPSHGGLASLVAKSRFSTRTRLSGRSAGVRFVGTNAHDIEAMDKGILRHPVFGRKKWAQQSVRPNWFTGPLEHSAPEFRTGIQRVMEDVASKVERSV